MSAEGALSALARLYGLETAHTDGLGRRVEVGEEPLIAVLRSLGAPLATAADAGEALRARRTELARRRIDPVVVCWQGRFPWVPLRGGAAETVSWTLTLESGERRSGEAALGALPELPSASAENGDDGPARRRLCLGADLAHGYHRLTLDGGGWTAEALVIAAPRSTFAGGGRPAWVPFLPLYALRTARDWGAGDLTDLGRLQAWAAGLGAGAVATLPLLASFLDRPLEPSPYAPLSRRFWNELYLDPTRAPGFAACAEAQRLVASAGFQAERTALQAAPLVDYRGAMALKRRVCELLARDCRARDGEDRRQLESYLVRRPEAATYAAFRALVERHGTAWPEWPARLRDGGHEGGRDVAAAALEEAPEESRFVHLWMQWVVDHQIAELARRGEALGVGLYLDFPLGVEAGGYDVWKDRDLFARGVAAGAPPDSLFTHGQDWGLPPLHPEALRARGYEYWIASLRHHLAPAALLRIDHVMQLHRLYWVPDGATAEQGVYVRYPAEELLAVVCLESRRQRTAIAGENLGTVPQEVEEAMARHGLLGLRVLEYELSPDHPPRPLAAGCVAALNTHDMPTFQGFCAGRDLDDLHAMGLLETGEYERRRAERCHLVGALTAGLAGDKLGEEEKALGKEKEEKAPGREGPAAGGAPAAAERSAGGEEDALRDLLERQLAWLAASPARWMVVSLEDLWGEEAPQNVPGTGPERPNWRRKAALPFEAFSSHPEILRALRSIDAGRRRAPIAPAWDAEVVE